MKPSALARRAAPRTSASGAPGLAYAMFSAIVMSKSTCRGKGRSGMGSGRETWARRPTLVFETRVAAAHRLLLDQADLPPEPAQLELAEVDAVEEQRAALWVVEALEQPAHR